MTLCIAGCASLEGLTGGDETDSAHDYSGDGSAEDTDGGAVNDAQSVPHDDVDPSDGSRAIPVLVQGNATFEDNSSSTTVTLSPSHAKNTIILGIGFDSKSSVAVSSITDNVGNTYVSAGYRATDTSCNEAAEIWYATNIDAGATSVVVHNTSTTGSTNEAWIMEFSGLSTTTPVVTGSVANNQPSATLAIAPQIQVARAGSVVVSTAIVCDVATGIHAGNPFIDLARENTEFTAYYITTGPGTFGAVWDMSNGTYCSTTAVFY